MNRTQRDLLLAVNGAGSKIPQAVGLPDDGEASHGTTPLSWDIYWFRTCRMTGRWQGHTAVTPIPGGDSELS